MEVHYKGYKMFKGLLGPLFKLYYRPKFINTEVIPKEGPIIVCGNHNHLYDQCLPILATKRMLHYMAKKEYFESPLAWFFKLSGCISVDRANHGGNSKEIALKILNNGQGIGIYPEGTRNSLICKKEKFDEIYENVKDIISKKKYFKLMKKQRTLVSQIDYLEELKNNKIITSEEYKCSLMNVKTYLIKLVDKKIISEEDYTKSLLLPLKFGAVSLAQKTNATIVPYGITGQYKLFNNNLTITFGTPFKVDNMSLEAANNKLTNIIESIIK